MDRARDLRREALAAAEPEEAAAPQTPACGDPSVAFAREYSLHRFAAPPPPRFAQGRARSPHSPVGKRSTFPICVPRERRIA